MDNSFTFVLVSHTSDLLILQILQESQPKSLEFHVIVYHQYYLLCWNETKISLDTLNVLKGIWYGFPVDWKAKQPVQIKTLLID